MAQSWFDLYKRIAMICENKTPVNPDEPASDEVTPAVENFNDADDNQVVNTANDAFDEVKPATADKTPVDEQVLPPGSTDILDDGEQPVLNQDDETI